jgi:hypothetical protein
MPRGAVGSRQSATQEGCLCVVFFGHVLKESSFERRCAVVVFAVANLGLFFDPIETSHVHIHTIQRHVCILCLIAVQELL